MQLPLESIPIVSSIAVALSVGLAIGPVVQLWDRFSAWWLRDQLAVMDSLSLDRGYVVDMLRWWGAALIVVPMLVAFGLHLWVLALPIAILVVMAPRIWLMQVIQRHRQRIRSQLAGAMVGLANTCRAGLPFSSGFRAVAPELEEPLRGEFNWIIMNQMAGRPLAKVLEECKLRLNIEAFTLFAATVQVTLERGGPVTEMLDRLSESIRELDRLERMMDATTASSRKVVLMLSIFPAIFLMVFSVLFPEGTSLMFTTILGQVLLLVTSVLVYGSVVWSNKILKFRD